MENLILSDLYETAVRAHNGTSFSPEKRGESVVRTYSQELEEDLKAMPESERERYTENYRKYLSAYLYSKANVISPMITGPANFPTARNEKRSRWADNHYSKFRAWREKALKAIKRKVREARPEEEKKKEEWLYLRRDIVHCACRIIDYDTGKGKGYNRALFVKSITEKVKRLAYNGELGLVVKAVELVKSCNEHQKKPVISSRHEFWTYPDVAAQVKAQQIKQASQEPEETEINGIKIVDNFQDDRVQIFFPDKPDYEVIRRLKKSAWKWSRYSGCWQRKLTDAAKYSAKEIVQSI